MHRAVGRAWGKALEALVQFARAEHRQHHELVEIGAAARDADLLAHDRMAAVAADHVVGLEHFAARRPRPRGDRDPHARCRPARPWSPSSRTGSRRSARSPSSPAAPLPSGIAAAGRSPGNNRGGRVRGRRRVPVFAHQVAVGGDLADRIAARHEARRAQLIDDAPEIEMLERALREVLPLGNPVHPGPGLHQRAGDAAQAEIARRAPRRPGRRRR